MGNSSFLLFYCETTNLPEVYHATSQNHPQRPVSPHLRSKSTYNHQSIIRKTTKRQRKQASKQGLQHPQNSHPHEPHRERSITATSRPDGAGATNDGRMRRPGSLSCGRPKGLCRHRRAVDGAGQRGGEGDRGVAARGRGAHGVEDGGLDWQAGDRGRVGSKGIEDVGYSVGWRSGDQFWSAVLSLSVSTALTSLPMNAGKLGRGRGDTYMCMTPLAINMSGSTIWLEST